MPPAESVFGSFSNRDIFLVCAPFLLAFILIWFNKLPAPIIVKHYLSALNERGGNILILFLLSTWFFAASQRMFYYAFWAMEEKKLEPENAVLMMGLQWAMGTAFGGAVSVLYKTMTGSDSITRASDSPRTPGSTVATVTVPPGASGSVTIPSTATPGESSATISAPEAAKQT